MSGQTIEDYLREHPLAIPSAEQRTAWKQQGRCLDCGAGYWTEDNGFHIQPHDLGCPTLSKIVERSKTHCVSCGSPLTFERGGDVWYCPNGHTSGMQGEPMLEHLDATGSGWMREILEDGKSKERKR